MIKPTQDDIGREVVYTGNTYPGGMLEYGVITSFNEVTVFVRYDGKRNAQATSPSDLEWSLRNKEGLPS